MTRPALPARHQVAAAFLVAGFGINLRAGQLGLRTICTAGRERTHVDHPIGFALSLGAIAAVAVGFAFHYLNPEKRPVR